MNEWVQRSIGLANSRGYLDKLYRVYPYMVQVQREIDPRIEQELKKCYEEKNKTELIKLLLKLEKFPVDDPYVGFLRKKKGLFLDYNPQTVNRLANRVLSMGFGKMMKGAKQPKKESKQSGPLFKKWLPEVGCPLLPENKFETCKGIAIFKGSNGQLRDYADRKLSCNLTKNPDFLARVGETYIVGEAKFITAIGGGQDRGFDDAMNLLRSKEGNAMRIAILDGVVWIKSNAGMHRIVCGQENPVLSALLLKDFLENLYRKGKQRAV